MDTNVVSELRKRSPGPGVMAWFDTARPSVLFLSSLAIGEIRLGIERLRRKDEVQARAIERWLTGLRTLYRDRIVSVDAGIAEVWGWLRAPTGCRVQTADSALTQGAEAGTARGGLARPGRAGLPRNVRSNEEARASMSEEAGPEPPRRDKRQYFVLMGVCVTLFVLSWAVVDRYSVLAAVIMSAVALVIPPLAAIVANRASAVDRRRPLTAASRRAGQPAFCSA